MSRRKKIIIAVIILLAVVLLAILLFWFFYQRPARVITNANANVGLHIPQGLPSASAGLEPAPSTQEMKNQTSVRTASIAFAERFGSYSNQGNFSNLESLQDIISPKMKSWIDNYRLAQNVQNQASGSLPYYGITTKALSVKMDDIDDALGQAQVVVATQRQEAKNSTDNIRVFYQNLSITLVKIGDNWKVDSAQWQ